MITDDAANDESPLDYFSDQYYKKPYNQLSASEKQDFLVLLTSLQNSSHNEGAFV